MKEERNNHKSHNAQQTYAQSTNDISEKPNDRCWLYNFVFDNQSSSLSLPLSLTLFLSLVRFIGRFKRRLQVKVMDDSGRSHGTLPHSHLHT